MPKRSSKENEILQALNPPQREAVLHGEGPLLIFAGAGSGKTRVLTHRAAYLVAQGVSPRNILAVTFTNKAANEMKQRILKLVDQLRWEMWVGTFHATCARILRQDGEWIGLDTSFVVFDESDQMVVMKDCLQELGINPEQLAPGVVLNEISRAKNELVTARNYAQYAARTGRRSKEFEQTVTRAYYLYQAKLKENQAVDFDDLIMYTVQLLDEHPDVLDRYQERFRYILVDEYQDINFAQYRFIRLLADKYRNLCVVGDDDQSIYGWRGADMRIILQFAKDYPKAKVVKLEQNYRSTKNILETAHQVISANRIRHEKQLWTEKESGPAIACYQAQDEHQEAVFIAQTIEQMMKDNGLRPSDFALLYRINAQSRVFERVFMSFELTYQVVGGLRFYERKEVKDILSYLRVIHNPHDSVSLKRIINVPTRGIGEKTLGRLKLCALERNISLYDALAHVEYIPSIAGQTVENLQQFARNLAIVRKKAEKLSLTELTRFVIEESGYRLALEEEGTLKARTRLENIHELLSATREFEDQVEEPTLGVFLEQVALISDIDTKDDSLDAVSLITLHSAKGLEFPVVFMVGMEEGLFPLSRAASSDNPMELEEERRLCYVGITRAQQYLFLTLAALRTLYGMTSRNLPSRFLRDLPEGIVQGMEGMIRPRAITWAEADLQTSPEAKEILEQATGEKSPYQPGDKVRHEKFGEGLVLSAEGTGDDASVTVYFPEIAQKKKLILSYAPLTKI